MSTTANEYQPAGSVECETDVRWVFVCRTNQVTADRGAAVMVDGLPIALFKLAPLTVGDEAKWYAVDHLDPVSNAPVMARGLVGSVGDCVTVASPLYKQRYSLETGACLDSPELKLDTHLVRITGDKVEISSTQPRLNFGVTTPTQ